MKNPIEDKKGYYTSVYRGGGWIYLAEPLDWYKDYRYYAKEQFFDNLGFRIVRNR